MGKERSFRKHTVWAKANNVHIDGRELVYDFCLDLINQIKPRNILCLGGYTNLDVFFATKDLDYAVNIINVDPLNDPTESANHIKKTHQLIQKHFKFKGKYKWIRETADLKKVGNRQWDLIWDVGCFEGDKIKFMPKNQTLFFYHYGHPRPLYNELKQIDKITPIQAFAKGMSFHGDIQKNIKKIIWPHNPYRSGIDLQNAKLNHFNEFFWPYNKRRVIPYVASGKNNEWKHQ